MAFPRDITVVFRVHEDGRMEIVNKEGKALGDVLSPGKTIKAHNAIGALITNPTESVCYIANGYLHCY